MPQFKTFKLGDAINLVKDGYTPSLTEHLHYIGLEHIEQQTLRLAGIGKSSDVTSNKFRFKSGDILFGKLRPYFRKVYRPKFDGVCSTDIWVVRAKKNFDQGFIYYLMASEEFVDLSSQGSSGTRMPRADWNNLKNIEWEFPSLPTQTRIAAILSSLDDKIELNRRTNATLEAMAQTLFKKYFDLPAIASAKEGYDIDPDNLPDGWRYEKVESLFDISIGRTPPRVQREWFSNNHEDVKWISIKDMGNSGTYIFETSEYLTKEAVKKFNVPVIPDNTVVLSFKLTVGRVAITTEKMLSNEAIAHFIPKKSTYLTPEYIFLFLKNFEYDSLGNTSSIATAVNSQTIKGINILVPDIEMINNFSSSVVTLFKRIKTNQEEIKTLIQIRDSLLPKLMSGEIEVNAAENELVS